MTILAGFSSYLFETIMLLSMYVSTIIHIRMDIVVIRFFSQDALVMRTTVFVCVKALTLPIRV